eukprot:6212848-Pleurochrysis_carterae.AAC.2
MTLAVGQVKDNALLGLRAMLGDGISSGNGADILELREAGVVGVDIVEDDGSEWTIVNHCEAVACLNLAAARGIRASQGKSACFCGCRGAAALQAYPGCDTVPSLPTPATTGSCVSTWREAEAMLAAFCSYDTPLMSYDSLEATGHVPPRTWDFQVHGPWSCVHCGSVMWTSRAEFEAAKVQLSDLAARGADGAGDDENAKKAFNKIIRSWMRQPLGRHLSLCTCGARWYELFCGGPHSLLAAERCKDVREFVPCLHFSQGQSPGLAANIWAIVERGFDSTLPLSAAAAPAAIPPFSGSTSSTAAVPRAPQPIVASRGGGRSRRKRSAPDAGFGTGDAEAEAEAAAEEDNSFLELDSLGALFSDEDAVRPFVRGKFDNHASEVLDVLRLWETFDDVYEAWGAPWTSDSEEERAERALCFLRAVEQIPMKAAAMEENWHGDSAFCTPEKLHLQQQLRSRKLKCDLGEDIGPRQKSA